MAVVAVAVSVVEEALFPVLLLAAQVVLVVEAAVLVAEVVVEAVREVVREVALPHILSLEHRCRLYDFYTFFADLDSEINNELYRSG